MSFAPRPLALVLSMIRMSRRGLWACGFGCWSLVGVAPPLAAFDPPLLPLRKFPGSSHPTLYSRPRSRSRFRPFPGPRAHSRARSRSRPCPRPCPRDGFLPPVPGALLSVRYHIVGHAPDLVPETADYPQAPPPVYRDDAACGMAVHGLLFCCVCVHTCVCACVFFTFIDQAYSLSGL